MAPSRFILSLMHERAQEISCGRVRCTCQQALCCLVSSPALCMSSGAMLCLTANQDADQTSTLQESIQWTEKQQALLLAMEKVQPSMHHSAQSGRHRMIEMVRARYVSNNCQQQYDIDCSQRLVGKLTLFISGIAGILMLPKYMKAGRVSLCIPYGCAVQCIRQQEWFHKTIDIECAILHIWSPHVTRARKC